MKCGEEGEVGLGDRRVLFHYETCELCSSVSRPFSSNPKRNLIHCQIELCFGLKTARLVKHNCFVLF